MVEPVIEQLKALILQLNPSLQPEQLHDNASIVEDLGMDSIVVVTLITLIEDHFGFVFGEEDLTMDTFASVRNLADFVSAHHSNGQGAGS